MALKYWLVIIALGLGWGISFVFNAVLLREIGPLWLALGRVGLGALGCWMYIAVRSLEWRVPTGMAMRLLAFGLLAYGAPFAAYALGQTSVSSGVAGIINASTSAFAVVASHFWRGGERATWLKSLGVLAAMFGIVLLSLPVLAQGKSSEIMGVLTTLTAPLCYALTVNVARGFPDVRPAVMVTYGLSGATVSLLPLALWHEGLPTGLSLQAAGALAVLGFGLTSIAFLVLYWVLPRVGATNVTLPTLIAPASALSLGVLLLGEPLFASHIWGLGSILLGLLLIDGRLPRRMIRKYQPIG